MGVEIDEDPVRTNKGYLFRACYSNGVDHCPLNLVDAKAGRGVGELDRRKIGKTSVCLYWRPLARGS